jgi:hypothetical protein
MKFLNLNVQQHYPGLHPRGFGHRFAAAHGVAEHPRSVYENGTSSAHHIPKNHWIRLEHLAAIDRKTGLLVFCLVLSTYIKTPT